MRKRLFPALLAMLVVLSSFGLASAQQDNSASQGSNASQGNDASQAPADNTKVNQRDRNTNEPTADQQKDMSLACRIHECASCDARIIPSAEAAALCS